MAGKLPAGVVLSSVIRQMLALEPLREQVEQGGRNAAQVVAGLKPPLFGPRRTMTETALSTWSLDMLGRALRRLADTVLESRQRNALESEIVRHTLLALATEARRARVAPQRRVMR